MKFYLSWNSTSYPYRNSILTLWWRPSKQSSTTVINRWHPFTFKWEIRATQNQTVCFWLFNTSNLNILWWGFLYANSHGSSRKVKVIYNTRSQLHWSISRLWGTVEPKVLAGKGWEGVPHLLASGADDQDAPIPAPWWAVEGLLLTRRRRTWDQTAVV